MSSVKKKFKQVDVFTSVKFKGNPVAVFLDGDSLTTEEMQQIATWTNLSETTFVLKPTTPDADYRLRIFTPASELPFAGHPTIGSCHAVIEAGVVKPKDGKIIQECLAGLVEITIDEQTKTASFKLPYYKHKKLENPELLEKISKALGLESSSQILSVVDADVGPFWLSLRVESAELLISLKPDFGKLKKISETDNISGYSLFGKHKENGLYEARNFIPLAGIDEDPVCGSGAGTTGSVLAELEDFEGEFLIKQGGNVGRDGRINVKVVKSKNGENANTIYVGGSAVTCLDGTW